MKLNTRTCDTYTRKTSPIFNIQWPVLFTSHSVIDDQPPTRDTAIHNNHFYIRVEFLRWHMQI